MADDRRDDNHPNLHELARAVRELSLRVSRLEQRLDQALTYSQTVESPAEINTNQNRSQFAGDALETRIGSQWLNRVGVVAVLFGVAYLLRYIFVNGWVSAAAWIWLGVSAGIAVILGSEWFQNRGYRVLSLSLKSTGIGISYLSLWAGLELYKLLSTSEAFTGLILLTILGVVLALRGSAEILAILALIAGSLTPLLIGVPSSEAPLFFYLAILDCAAAWLAWQRTWWKVLPVSFAGTVLLSAIWYYQRYSRSELTPAIVAATFFFLIYFASAAWMRRSLASTSGTRFLAALELVNAGAYFLSLYMLLDPVSHDSLTIPAALLAALYFGLAWREERHADKMVVVYGDVGIAFAAVALAIILPVDWISLGWFLEAALVMAVGFWKRVPWLRSGALLLLCAAIIKAFAYDVWQLGLGSRTLSFIGLGVLLLIMSFAYQRYGFSMISRSEKTPPDRQP